MENQWKGLAILNKFNTKNLKILLGEQEIIILIKHFNDKDIIIDLFLTLIFFLKLICLKISFSLFLDIDMNFKRKKIKDEIILQTLNSIHQIENFLSLIESSNQDVYYEFNSNIDEFIGIELRATEKITYINNNKHSIMFELVTEIREKKKSNFFNNKNE